MVITGIVVPVVIGLVFNWGFVLFMVFHAATSTTPPLWAWFWAALPVLALLFPFGYFWLAKSSAIRKGLRFVYDHAEGFVAGLADTAVGYLIGLESAEHISSTAVQQAGGLVKKAYEKMPSGIRRIVGFLMDRLPLLDWVEDIRSRVAFTAENRAALSAEMKGKMDTYVRQELLGADFPWLWVLAVLNLAAIVAVYLWVI